MKRPARAWTALLAVVIALVATLAAGPWLWSLEGSQALQALGGWLTLPMRLLSFLGDEQFYLMAMPLVYWCLHKALGADLGVLMVLSILLNTLTKSLIKHPRPFWEDARLQLDAETGFSTPSSHAQTSAALFGRVILFLAGPGARVILNALLVILIALIALSRVYLGVHFPGDIMWGLAVGLTLLTLYTWLKPGLLPGLKRMPLRLHVLLAMLAAALTLGAGGGLLALPFGTGERFPVLYSEAAQAMLENAATLAGLAAGLWIGLAAEYRYVSFSVAGPFRQRALRYLIGVAGLLAIWMGLRILFPQEPLALSLVLRVVRYALAMLWVILAWPWLFLRLGLGRREAGSDAGGPADHPAGRTPHPAGA